MKRCTETIDPLHLNELMLGLAISGYKKLLKIPCLNLKCEKAILQTVF
jgi:hypothetical protein